ncbi:unnamed protein product, partial [Mesorhabditis belari]|uniref:Uncharacterized protein n=1 Tax=Mesorhabditis belari TaxID=2138241 RepID=A0AAF3E945_9BILA
MPITWSTHHKGSNPLHLNFDGLMANQTNDSGFEEQPIDTNVQEAPSQSNGTVFNAAIAKPGFNNVRTHLEKTKSLSSFNSLRSPSLSLLSTGPSASHSIQWRSDISQQRRRIYPPVPGAQVNGQQYRITPSQHFKVHYQTGHQYCAGSVDPLNSTANPSHLYKTQFPGLERPLSNLSSTITGPNGHLPSSSSMSTLPLTSTSYRLQPQYTARVTNKQLPSTLKEQMAMPMQHVDIVQRDLEEEEGNFGYTDTYFAYRPSKLRCGLAHPDSVIETSSLSSVQLPDIHYVSRIPEHVIDTGAISALQYEALIYACQMHERLLPSGERAGYLIGDGAGVGKGRTIASLIYENYLADRKKSIWLSVSSDLRFDALRDLRDIGATNIKVHSLNKFRYTKISSSENGRVKKAMIFATYSSLIGECKTASKSYSSRIKQLVQWFGKSYDGLIVFDECHRAKNLVPGVGGKTTKTGRLVLELQKLLPNARIVYASATGATEPRNMAYMTRLGLWGEGRSFSNFGEFLGAVEKRGIGAMEIVAVEMKQRGLYLSRQLSFHGAAFRVEEIQLSDEYIKIYDNSVRLWTEVRYHFQNIVAKISQNERSTTNKFLWSQFWASHQRYFKYLCIAAKVDACVRLTRQAISHDKCVVIGLQSTGESRTREAIEEQGGELSEFVSTAKAVLQNLIDNHFPGIDDDPNDEFDQDFFDFDKKKKKRKAGDFDYTNSRGFQSTFDLDSKRSKIGSPEESAASDDDVTVSSEASQEYGGSDESETEMNGEDEDDWIKTLYEEAASGDESETTRDDENSRPASGIPMSGMNALDYEMELSILQSYLDEQNASFFEDEEVEDEINPFFADLTKYDPWADRQRGVVSVVKADEKDKKEKRRKSKKKKKQFQLELQEKQQLEEMLKKREQALEDASKHTAKDFLNLSRVCEELDHDINPSEIKAKLLVAVETLGRSLPPNTLDHLIDELGGPEFVAEMTGRRGRLVQNEEGKVIYELRHKNSDVPLEFINMEEKEKFMTGQKKVAIISEAASSGISLQADKRAENTLRRVHITLELPWSADKAIQQFGRTHRSNQVSAPEYVFLISELAGEKRFASIIAKRLESLGALTHGDRRATETQDFSQFNLDTKYGRQALECLLQSIIGTLKPPLIHPPRDYKPGSFFTDMAVYLESVGILVRTSTGAYAIEKDGQQMSKFLNRLLGIPVHAQSALFQYFSNILAELISQAKRDGTFDMGIMDLGSGGTQVQVQNTRVFLGSPERGSFRVEMHKIAVERGITWDEALSISKLHVGKEDGFYVLRKNTCKQQACILAYGVEMLNGDNKKSYIITRPSTGRSAKLESIADLSRKFVKTQIDTAEKLWKEQFDASAKMCQHHYIWGKCRTEESGRFCEVGRRMRTYFVLSGSILSVWPIIENVFSSIETDKRKRQIQMIRVSTEQGQKIVGVLVLPLYVRALTAMSTNGVMPAEADNIIARKAQIKGKIDSIHSRKRLIVEKLREFHEKGFENDELKEKLLEAYDQLDSQEKEYMELFVDITRIHERATEDFTEEMLDMVDRLLEVRLEGMEAQPSNDDTEQLTLGLNDEIARLQNELLDNQSRALKATMINEQLIEQLSKEKTKQAYFNEYRKSSSGETKSKSQEAHHDVQAMRIRVHGEKHENDRKQKQLERLRRKAVEKGIMAGKEDEEQKNALSAQVDEKTRVPKFESKEKEVEESEEIEKTDEQLQEEKRREIRERLKQQREEREQYSSIRERFKAMEERKKRMENIREMLAKMQAIQAPSSTTENADAPAPAEEIDDEDPVKFLEDTYANAKAKLRELTTMRENLENIRDLTNQVDSEAEAQSSSRSDYWYYPESEITTALENEKPRGSLGKTLRKVIVTAPSAALLSFGSTLQRVAEREVPADLDERIEAFLSCSLESSTIDDNSYEEVDSSSTPIARSLVLANPQTIEAARKELNSTYEKEKKEKTLSRVIHQLESEEKEKKKKKKVEEVKEVKDSVEEAMRSVLEQVRPLIGGDFDVETAESIREIVIASVTKFCSKITDNYTRVQLGVLVSHSLAPYIGCSLDKCREEFLIDISDILYNELAFYHLLHSLNSITDSANFS